VPAGAIISTHRPRPVGHHCWGERSLDHLVRLLAAFTDGEARTLAACARSIGADSFAPDAFELRVLREHGVVPCSLDGQPALRVETPLPLLDATAIRAAMTAAASAATRRLDVVFSTDSTNARLLDRARGEPIDGHLLAAEHQSAGRGRRGRRWQSPVASNLYVSLGVEFPRIDALQCLSLFTGVAVVEALHVLGAGEVGIKWPNDVLHRGRKLAGILIESTPNPRGGISAVIGVGVNVRMPRYAAEAIDQPYAELAALRTAPVDRSTACAALANALQAMLQAVRRGERAPLLARYADHDVLRDRPVRVQVGDATAGRAVDGIARGIAATGELLVETGGAVQAFAAGEVSVRDAMPPSTSRG
jgi:BirA family biotin operon repressor/biotin-[acetyl-CoA-carboxylase] ligase